MKKEYSDILLKNRNGLSEDYNGCPQYISIEAIKSLYAECGLNYESQSIGALGDILENFAVEILGGLSNKVSPSDLKKRIKEIMGS